MSPVNHLLTWMQTMDLPSRDQNGCLSDFNIPVNRCASHFTRVHGTNIICLIGQQMLLCCLKQMGNRLTESQSTRYRAFMLQHDLSLKLFGEGLRGTQILSESEHDDVCVSRFEECRTTRHVFDPAKA